MSSADSNTTQHLQQARTQYDLSGPEWLEALQSDAWQEFCQRGFPSRREEHWKYTDLTFLAKYPFTCAPSPAELTLPAEERLDVYRLVFVNGYFIAELSALAELPPEVTVLPLSQALLKYPEQIEPALVGTKTLSSSQPLALLNLAFAQEGLYVHLPPHTVLAKPLHLLFIAAPTDSAPILCQPRHIFKLENHSKAVIMEEHCGATAAVYYKNAVTTVELKSAAILDYYKIQSEGAAAIHTAATYVVQQPDSRFSSYSISLGSQLARDDLQVTLADASSCQLRGLYLLAASQHVDHHTRIDHRGVGARSEENYKGILADKAQGVFNGKIIVHPGAQKTQSQQSNKSILLTKTAEMNTKPELEIYADDVQCRHGATVGQLDPEALFYLRSRGVAVDAATAMLTQAFVEELLTPIPAPQIAAYIRRVVTEKLAACSAVPQPSENRSR